MTGDTRFRLAIQNMYSEIYIKPKRFNRLSHQIIKIQIFPFIIQRKSGGGGDKSGNKNKGSGGTEKTGGKKGQEQNTGGSGGGKKGNKK